jgi:HrpA-like RNA helicase
VLEETCKKKKLVQPKFTRLPSKSGYRLSVSTSKKAKASEWIALTTNFRSNGSLQDYLAAQALYAIDPTMPIYLMFPPSFKLIWQLWQAEEKEEKNALKDEEGRTDSERILRLLSLIKDKSVMSHPAMGKIQSIIDSELEYDQTAPDDTWEDRSIEDDHVKPIRTAGADAQRMRDEFTQCLESPKYLGMLQYRNGLPMAGFRDQFLQTVEAHPVTILCAETGAGKSEHISYSIRLALARLL